MALQSVSGFLVSLPNEHSPQSSILTHLSSSTTPTNVVQEPVRPRESVAVTVRLPVEPRPPPRRFQGGRGPIAADRPSRGRPSVVGDRGTVRTGSVRSDCGRFTRFDG